MAKKKAKNRNNGNNKGFKIPEDVKSLLKLDFKKFKKKNKDYYDSKKELKSAYYAQELDLFPAAIQLVVRYGHIADVKETKEAIYARLTDPDFIKYLKKELKNGFEFDNMELLPTVVNDIVIQANKQAASMKEENPDSEIELDLSDIVEVSSIILKKKLKKFKKAGIDEALAFDVLSVIPTTDLLKKSQYFHIRSLFNVLYEHAKTKEIDFGKVIKCLFKGEDDYIPSIITFALLERKEKIGNFNETQKKLFNDITEYSFKTMEDMKKDDILAILKVYINSRKRDESQNKDSNRRYYISSLPESDYPKITKVVEKIIEKDEDLKKYF